ncbi:MAG TPA: hypothetical protein VHE34_00740 [Puia sp.]|uniref:hypothetical protein n=1 Tax=Puia sp. TaxID=2045100 RepID=UPI002BCBEB63|nr:hypothetical protein [Puia sp.]HVU93712.1 hypothetical protein [Puia sp.]
MSEPVNYQLDPIGVIQSSLRTREDAPRQGFEGAPDAWLELKEGFVPALRGVRVGDELIVITWFHPRSGTCWKCIRGATGAIR